MLEYFIYFLYFIVGACVGSFSNVVACRLPIKMSLIKPNSKCFSCGRELKPLHNIPILSYIFLRGKCKFCGAKIGIRDFLVELLSAVLYLLIGIFFYSQSLFLSILLCLSVSVLIIISCIDLDHMQINMTLLIILLCFSIVIAFVTPNLSIVDHLIGLLVGGGFLGVIYGVGYLIVKKEVVGLGDIKLMTVCGLLLGWKSVIFAYFVALIVASVVLLIVRLIKKDKRKNVEYPFAPFLALGVIVSIFLGDLVMNAYLSLFIL